MQDMTPNPRKTTSIRRLGPVDIGALREAVLALPEEVWDLENADKPNQRFDVLQATRHIVFRFVAKFQDWRESYERPLGDEFKPLLEPVLAAATAPYGYENGAFPRVMLARMGLGGAIRLTGTPTRPRNGRTRSTSRCRPTAPSPLPSTGPAITSPRARRWRSTTWASTP
jgi:hypothetical protein